MKITRQYQFSVVHKIPNVNPAHACSKEHNHDYELTVGMEIFAVKLTGTSIITAPGQQPQPQAIFVSPLLDNGMMLPQNTSEVTWSRTSADALDEVVNPVLRVIDTATLADLHIAYEGDPSSEQLSRHETSEALLYWLTRRIAEEANRVMRPIAQEISDNNGGIPVTYRLTLVQLLVDGRGTKLTADFTTDFK